MRGGGQCLWLTGALVSGFPQQREKLVPVQTDISSFKGCVWTEKDLLSPKSYHTGCVNILHGCSGPGVPAGLRLEATAVPAASGPLA